jgi:hypothetical protein
MSAIVYHSLLFKSFKSLIEVKPRATSSAAPTSAEARPTVAAAAWLRSGAAVATDETATAVSVYAIGN